MEFLKKLTRNKFENFLVLAIFSSIIVLIISCIKYIYFGSVNWDEPFQLSSIYDHLRFGSKVLNGEGGNYQDLPANTEWYGVGLKFIYAAPLLAIRKFISEESRFLQFSSLRGFALLIYLSSGVVFYYTSNFYQKRKSKILALIYFTFPLLAGESYLNITDIPMAICFSFYSLLNGIIVISEQNKIASFNRVKKISDGKPNSINNYKLVIYFSSVFMAALLINSKASMLAPVLIIESFLALYLINKKVTIYKKALNFLQTIMYRLISIFAITYLITPPAWLNPFKYYLEVITNFSKFKGTHLSRIGGFEITTNTDSWNLFEYLWRWLQIKIPLIMILLIFIFFSYCIYQLIFKNEIRHISILRNPLLTFYFLQLTVTPGLAIIANSSTYNVLRHWCFIYPPLIIFSAFVIDNLLLNSRSEVFNKISKLAVGIFAVLGIVDNVMLMPYSNLSFNTYGRRFVKVENTDIDYWGYSAGEILKSNVIKGYEVQSNNAPFRTETSHRPHHIKSERHKYQFAYAGVDNIWFSKINNDCIQIKNVKRNFLFRKEPLIFSKIGICPLFSGNSWKVWSTNKGEIRVEYIIDGTSFILPRKINSLAFRRIKEYKNNSTKLSILFLDNGIFSIVDINYKAGKIFYDSLSLPEDKEIISYVNDFSIPKNFIPRGKNQYIAEWELGFDIPKVNVKKFYEDKNVSLFNLDEKFVGIVCKRNNKRSFRTILKKSNAVYIDKPNGRSGDFVLKRVVCIRDSNNNIEKITLIDSGGDASYKWEINLNGILIKSEKI